jgi:hypothetical protein
MSRADKNARGLPLNDKSGNVRFGSTRMVIEGSGTILSVDVLMHTALTPTSDNWSKNCKIHRDVKRNSWNITG